MKTALLYLLHPVVLAFALVACATSADPPPPEPAPAFDRSNCTRLPSEPGVRLWLCPPSPVPS